MTNLSLKSRDITSPGMVCLVKAMVFPVVKKVHGSFGDYIPLWKKWASSTAPDEARMEGWGVRQQGPDLKALQSMWNFS